MSSSLSPPPGACPLRAIRLMHPGPRPLRAICGMPVFLARFVAVSSVTSNFCRSRMLLCANVLLVHSFSGYTKLCGTECTNVSTAGGRKQRNVSILHLIGIPSTNTVSLGEHQ